MRDTTSVGWSPEAPAKICLDGGKHTWNIGSGQDAIPLARHTALSDDGHDAAEPSILASRAEGAPVWGVLRGDVDNFGIRLRRVQTIEEHVQLSVLYKQFFAGELEVLCSMPEFWRKVTLLYAGGDDFIVHGAWDALIAFARELQRLFHRFSEEHLKDFPGPEGKTISMALALAPDIAYNLRNRLTRIAYIFSAACSNGSSFPMPPMFANRWCGWSRNSARHPNTFGSCVASIAKRNALRRANVAAAAPIVRGASTGGSTGFWPARAREITRRRAPLW
jgi:hypothetical protein